MLLALGAGSIGLAILPLFTIPQISRVFGSKMFTDPVGLGLTAFVVLGSVALSLVGFRLFLRSLREYRRALTVSEKEEPNQTSEPTRGTGP
jgi:hypothetical protein